MPAAYVTAASKNSQTSSSPSVAAGVPSIDPTSPLRVVPPSQPPAPVVPFENPGPNLAPIIVGGISLEGMALTGVGVAIPVIPGGEGIPEVNPLFNHKSDSKPDNNGDITLYRGVDPSNPNFKWALKGLAVPLGLEGGHNDPARHNGGDTYSIYTSWTTRPSVAVKFAGRYEVVLVQTFKIGSVFPSPDAFNEQELLVPGVVQAQVFNSWTWKKL
jgi:hypothetical protein